MNQNYQTQNTILVNCFNSELNSIRTLEDIKTFQTKLYNFKHLIISTYNYNFYNEFYSDMMNKLEEKREFILKFGNISAINSFRNELSFIEEKTFGFQFFKELLHKLKMLIEYYIK